MGERHVYALIVDTTEDSLFVPALLTQIINLIHERRWPEVRSVVMQVDVPMSEDLRRQDPNLTTAEVRLVDNGGV